MSVTYKDTWYLEFHKKYSHLFVPRENGNPVRGIEVGFGWMNPVERFLDRLEWMTKNYKDADGSPLRIKVFWIKEKFGRVRSNGIEISDERYRQFINEAEGYLEADCDMHCEKCGSLKEPGTISLGWTYGWCDDCAKEKLKEVREEIEEECVEIVQNGPL